MNYGEIHTHINPSNYDAIISIGNKCPTAMVLREIGIYKESFPFDYVPTTPKLILKYLKDPLLFYPAKDEIRTDDNVWFGHFDVSNNYYSVVETFNRRFYRLFNLLNNKQKILFVYSAEADIYNEMNNRYNDNYSDLKALRDYIINTYKYTDFTILAIHTNKLFEPEPNFIHYTINVHQNYLSDYGETNIPEVFNIYRTVLMLLFKTIFTV
jgi:hypothetical protein